MATFPCPVCNETLLTPRFTDDGVTICPFCGEEIVPPEGWGRLDNEPAEAIPVPVPEPGGDIVSRLERLAALHKAGALTDDEFAALKTKLLDAAL